ncbi:MAG: hypothetical protein JO171_12175, partial [Paludibacterium sp.]
ALLAWGNKHFAPEGESVTLVNKLTGLVADPVLVDRANGQPVSGPDYEMRAGPAAGERIHQRIAAARRAGR